MRGVAVSFHTLKIIAFQVELKGAYFIWRSAQPFVIWKQRHLLFWSHVSEDRTSCLTARISVVADLVFQRAAGGLCRSVNDITLNVILPAMINAPQPAIFIAPEE